eukprot:6060160-Pleurochrysis_carterae.AAC.1
MWPRSTQESISRRRMCVAGACAVGTVNSALRNPVAAATTIAARSEVPRREDHSRGFGAAVDA